MKNLTFTFAVFALLAGTFAVGTPATFAVETGAVELTRVALEPGDDDKDDDKDDDDEDYRLS